MPSSSMPPHCAAICDNQCHTIVWTSSAVPDSVTSLLTGFLCIAADDLNLLCCEFLTRIALEFDLLDDERPHVVAKAVGLEVTLDRVSYGDPKHPEILLTLNVSLDLTFSARFSAIARSKLARIFIASCGSMRPSLIRSSIVSISASPILEPLSQYC